MSDTAFRDSSDRQGDDADDDFMHIETMPDEFISEIGQVMDLPNLDADGYVGPDGRPQPHQTPAEVAAATNAVKDDWSVADDRHMREEQPDRKHDRSRIDPTLPL